MSDSAGKTMTPLEWGMLLLLSLFWGGSFFFVGVAVKELPPLTIVALRVSLAAAILWLCAPALGLVMPRRREVLIAFLGMGLLNNVIPFCLIVWGQTQLASGLASILNATTPLFTVLVGHFVSADDRLTPLRLAGALCGLVGVAGMIGPQLDRRTWRRVARRTRYSRRRGRLCLREPVRTAVPTAWRRSDRHRDWPGHRLEPDPDPDRAACRSPLDPAHAQRGDIGGRRRDRRPFRRPSPISFISAFWPAPARPMSCSSRSWRPSVRSCLAPCSCTNASSRGISSASP